MSDTAKALRALAENHDRTQPHYARWMREGANAIEALATAREELREAKADLEREVASSRERFKYGVHQKEARVVAEENASRSETRWLEQRQMREEQYLRAEAAEARESALLLKLGETLASQEAAEARAAGLKSFAHEFGDHNPLCRSLEDSRLNPREHCDCGFIARWDELFAAPHRRSPDPIETAVAKVTDGVVEDQE